MKELFWSLLKLESVCVVFVFKFLGWLRLFTFYQPIPQLGITTTRSMTQLAQARWESITTNLPQGRQSILDVGCNAGYFSIQLAELGHYVLGIDLRTYYTFCVAAKKVIGLQNLTFSDYRLTPKSTSALPAYDCVICMSIFHHWCMAFGDEAASDMLAALFVRTNHAMFFETAQSNTTKSHHREAVPDMGESPEGWMHEFFRSRGATEVKTIGVNRGRYLVVAYK